MLEQLTSEQLMEWMIFEGLEPWGELQEDRRAGTIAATITNSNPYRGRNAKFMKPEDYFASLRGSGGIQGAEEMKAAAMRWAQTMQGGKAPAVPIEAPRIMNQGE